MARFYVEGIEIEINDPTFYQSVEKIQPLIDHLSEYVNDYTAQN